MKIKEIRELAEILSQNGLSALEVVEGDTRIRMERSAAPASVPRPVEAAAPAPAKDAEPDGQDSGVDFSKLTEIRSPLVGVFYAAPSPEAAPYVKVGSTVRKGDVVCIVEAMKLMNEIVAEQDGTIVDICAHDGDVVEYGQTLFKMS